MILHKCWEVEVQHSGGSRKFKVYTAFMDKQRAKVGKYAAEHGNSSAVKYFGKEINGLQQFGLNMEIKTA